LRGVKRSRATPGVKVCVLGVGPIGLGAVIWLRHIGVTDIAAIDLSAARVELARDLGARTVHLGGDRGALESLLSSAHGWSDDDRGRAVDTDVFIDCSGSEALVDEAVNSAKEGAHFTLIGLHHKPVPLRLNRVVLRELSIVGSRGYPDEFNEVVAALPELGKQLDRLITHRYPLAEFGRAVEAAGSADAGKVLLEVDPRTGR
jgi:threonine dehydrogenase-like Zn-dependent dehydrogenase